MSSIFGEIIGNGGDDSEGSSGRLLDEDALSGSVSDVELLPGADSGRADDTVMGDGLGAETLDDELMESGDLGGENELMMDDLAGDPLDDDLGGDDLLSDDEGPMSFDGMDDDQGDGASGEVESRVGDIETEVGSLSSSVNTVQSENEKITESLEDIEENIRKLLEVYEMVTQGVNPFVEGDSLAETFGEGPSGPGNGSFGGDGLFDSHEGNDEATDMDDDITDAAAENFLDDDFEADEFGDGSDEEEFDSDLDDEFTDDFDDGFDESGLDSGFDGDGFEDEEPDGGGGGDGLSFDQLKAEYDSGDAEWATSEAGPSDDNAADSPDEDDEFSESLGDDEFSESLGDDEGAVDGERVSIQADASVDDADGIEADPAEALDEDTVTAEHSESEVAEPDENHDREPAVSERTHATANTDETSNDNAGNAGRPYLRSIPSEYNTEFLVMEWLEYLIDVAGLNGAACTLRYYGSIRWLSADAEAHLQTMLNGFNGGPDLDEPQPTSSLGVDHRRSLWWINRIAHPEKSHASYEAWLESETLDGTSPQNRPGAAEDTSTLVEYTDETASVDGKVHVQVNGPASIAEGAAANNLVSATSERGDGVTVRSSETPAETTVEEFSRDTQPMVWIGPDVDLEYEESSSDAGSNIDDLFDGWAGAGSGPGFYASSGGDGSAHALDADGSRTDLASTDRSDSKTGELTVTEDGSVSIVAKETTSELDSR